jgi:hypothetical protein
VKIPIQDKHLPFHLFNVLAPNWPLLGWQALAIDLLHVVQLDRNVQSRQRRQCLFSVALVAACREKAIKRLRLTAATSRNSRN